MNFNISIYEKYMYFNSYIWYEVSLGTKPKEWEEEREREICFIHKYQRKID